MKRLLTIAGCLALAATGWADVEWRTFENSDKSKFFKGRLVGYDSARNKVTVQKQSTMRSITFSLDLLSEDHQKFVKERSMELEAAGGLRMMFYENVEKVSSNRTSTTRTNNYNGGYKIEIRNYLRKAIQDVEIDYIVIYRKDSTKGNGTLATKKGSKNLTALVPNYDENLVIDGIPLKSYYKAGSVSVSGGST